MTTHHVRQFPIILITGTPGTGKSLHAQTLSLALESSSQDLPFTHLDIGKIVKEHGFHEGFDDEWQSYTVDEDRLLDWLEEVVNPEDKAAATGFIIDHHDPALFPERWIDLAVVLTCDNKVLHERLTARNYPPNKLSENITAEIMQTCLSETRESYSEEIVVELKSDGTQGGDGDVDENVQRIVTWVEAWCRDRREGVHGGENEDERDEGEGDEGDMDEDN